MILHALRGGIYRSTVTFPSMKLPGGTGATRAVPKGSLIRVSRFPGQTTNGPPAWIVMVPNIFSGLSFIVTISAVLVAERSMVKLFSKPAPGLNRRVTGECSGFTTVIFEVLVPLIRPKEVN